MNVCVLGLWHLGTVTAACLAAGMHDVTGLDSDAHLVASLGAAQAPLVEPGLNDLVAAGLQSGRLHFTTDIATATAGADIVWIACDTPVDDDDRADVDHVVNRVATLFPYLHDGTLVLISSQVPVGTTRRLEDIFARESQGRTVGFGYSPENLQLGKAIDGFTRPARVVAGVRSHADRERVEALLRPFTGRIEWMGVESAEMTKHALNAFLATSVAFINEIGVLCEQLGADASDVAKGLKSDVRIGARAYLSPGSAFAGGTLARDLVFLSQLGQRHGVATHLVSSVKISNDAHRRWPQNCLSQVLNGLSGQTVALWGLTYKPGTDTLRRSSAVELCEWLHEQGATVRAHDPAVKQLPPNVASHVRLTGNPLDAATGASALVVATSWPEYRHVAVDQVMGRMARRLVLDADRFLSDTLGRHPDIEYLSVGKAA